MNPLKETLPLDFLTLGLFIIAAVSSGLLADRTLSLKLLKEDEVLRSMELEIHPYRQYRIYMSRRVREALDTRFRSTVIRGLPRLRFLLSSREKVLELSLHSRFKTIQSFLTHFPEEYVKHVTQENAEFFENRYLDSNQIEAVVKDDQHNLVIAGPGSGKTKVLTTRLEFLCHQGLPAKRLLALTYTKAARSEMTKRLRDSGSTPKIMTIHSFSREIARSSNEFRSGVAANSETGEIIRNEFDRLSSADPLYEKLVLQYLSEQDSKLERKDFENNEKYYEYLKKQKYETLNSCKVKSIAERDIANFLFIHQIKFQYEKSALWADRDDLHREYRPDFYLPEYDIYLEHWAIDRSHNVPAWFDWTETRDVVSKRYLKAMEWKRSQFRKHNKTLLQTNHYQWKEESLEDDLKSILLSNKVKLNEMGVDQIRNKILTLLPRKDPLIEDIHWFIKTAKSNGLSIEKIKSRLQSSKWVRRQRTLAQLTIPIWEKYESWLLESQKLDFDDMINLATKVVLSSSSIESRFDHILVDEFQDVTDQQMRLISGLMGKETKLFCVGDDYQNIFSFAGSNIDNILQFQRFFPLPEKTVLPINYRCPKTLVDASDALISHNKYQVHKDISAVSKVHYSISLHEISNKNNDYELDEFNAAKEVIEEILHSKSPDETILVLTRFNFRLEELKMEFSDPSLAFASIHKAKGREADYVLVLGCLKGTYGLPSEMDSRVNLKIAGGSRSSKLSEFEEERRLFYVAMTRCKKSLFLFTDKKKRSVFLDEISSFISPIDEHPRMANPAPLAS